MFIFSEFWNFVNSIIKNRTLLLKLTQHDFKQKYLGSLLGGLWAFIQPALTIIILWFVFAVGFKPTTSDDFPFILWLASGLIPWFFISDAISCGTGSIIENSHLVKKVVFKVSLLPVIKILCVLILHIFFLCILFLLFISYGFYPDMYWIQLPYYIAATCCIVLGISWFTSSSVVFLRDISHAVGIFLQFGFWLTPIFWNINMVPESYRTLVKLNPFFYLIDGYRKTFLTKQWFFEDSLWTVYFWVLTGFIMLAGAFLFRKLRPHLADVL